MHLSIVTPNLGKGGDMWGIFPLLTLSYTRLGMGFSSYGPRPWYVWHYVGMYTARSQPKIILFNGPVEFDLFKVNFIWSR
jgi:hypothetical protein